MSLFRFNLKNILSLRNAYTTVLVPLMMVLAIIVGVFVGTKEPYLLETDLTVQRNLADIYELLYQQESLTPEFIQAKQEFDYVASQLRLNYDHVFNEAKFQEVNSKRLEVFDEVLRTIPEEYVGMVTHYRMDLEKSQYFIDAMIDAHQPIQASGHQLMIVTIASQLFLMSFFSFSFFYWMIEYVNQLREKKSLLMTLAISRYHCWGQPLLAGELFYFIVPSLLYIGFLALYSVASSGINLFLYPIVGVSNGIVVVYSAGMLFVGAFFYQLMINVCLYLLILLLKLRDASSAVLCVAGTAILGSFYSVDWLITQWFVFWRVVLGNVR